MSVLIAVIVILLAFFYWRPALIIAAVILVVLLGIGLHSVVDAFPSGVAHQFFSVASGEELPAP
jgi:membrane-bound metal-dependent hydrolase YbcI (DUF457 family)